MFLHFSSVIGRPRTFDTGTLFWQPPSALLAPFQQDPGTRVPLGPVGLRSGGGLLPRGRRPLPRGPVWPPRPLPHGAVPGQWQHRQSRVKGGIQGWHRQHFYNLCLDDWERLKNYSRLDSSKSSWSGRAVIPRSYFPNNVTRKRVEPVWVILQGNLNPYYTT